MNPDCFLERYEDSESIESIEKNNKKIKILGHIKDYVYKVIEKTINNKIELNIGEVLLINKFTFEELKDNIEVIINNINNMYKTSKNEYKIIEITDDKIIFEVKCKNVKK